MIFRHCCGIKTGNNKKKNRIKIEKQSDRLEAVSTEFHQTTFEELPNELIIMLFNYLYFHEITRAFGQLNNRFQMLLSSFDSYHVNFHRLITRQEFNVMKNLCLNPENIQSLILSNKNFAYTSIQQCLSMYPFESLYARLRSLSVMDFKVAELLSLIPQLSNFQQLKYLSIGCQNRIRIGIYDIDMIRGQVLFEIKTLKYFSWNTYVPFFCGADTTFSSKRSSIEHYEFCQMNVHEFAWLNFHTTTIKSICVHEINFDVPFQKNSTFETVTRLRIDDSMDFIGINCLLENLSCFINLRSLDLQFTLLHLGDDRKFIFGFIWEEYLRYNLPKLEIFRFIFTLRGFRINQETLMNSFRTDFWLIEKQWFVSSDYCDDPYFVRVYTIPYMSETLVYPVEMSQQMSTTTVNNLSNVRFLSFAKISLAILADNRFKQLQALELHKVADEISYNQLNKFLNLSSIQIITVKRMINSELFLSILKSNTAQLLIEINFLDLLHLLRDARRPVHDEIIVELRKIKRVTLLNGQQRSIKISEIRKICGLFPGVEHLMIVGHGDAIRMLEILLQRLRNLCFFEIGYKHSGSYRGFVTLFNKDMMNNEIGEFVMTKHISFRSFFGHSSFIID